jgi:predicted metal-binding transcription factor (methanogenesis marker protein 9)
MRAFILSIAIFSLQLNSVSGQSKIVLEAPNRIDTTIRPLVLVNAIKKDSGQTRIVLYCKNRVDTTIIPLILVDTFKTDFNHLVLDPKEIESIEVLKDSTAKLKYGDAGKFGVIIIYPKPRVKFLRVDKILKIYNLSNEDKKLRICINKTLLRNPQLLLIEKSQIESVEVTTDRNGINIHDANSGEKFINIITRTKNNNGL